MAIVSGLIFWLKNQSFNSGEIILLFQPAEENGKGANRVLKDERFKSLKTVEAIKSTEKVIINRRTKVNDKKKQWVGVVFPKKPKRGGII